jgi:ferrous iron transport protein B
VSTLGVLYGQEETDAESVNLSGRIHYTPAVAIAFMLFVLLYFPCIATLAAIKNESNSWRWALFSVVYNTALAWVVAFIAYQVLSRM